MHIFSNIVLRMAFSNRRKTYLEGGVFFAIPDFRLDFLQNRCIISESVYDHNKNSLPHNKFIDNIVAGRLESHRFPHYKSRRSNMTKIMVDDISVNVVKFQDSDFISLTDIAKRKTEEPNVVIGNWMRNRNTIEYLGTWETLYNPHFNPIEFEGFK